MPSRHEPESISPEAIMLRREGVGRLGLRLHLIHFHSFQKKNLAPWYSGLIRNVTRKKCVLRELLRLIGKPLKCHRGDDRGKYPFLYLLFALWPLTFWLFLPTMNTEETTKVWAINHVKHSSMWCTVVFPGERACPLLYPCSPLLPGACNQMVKG